MLSAFGIQNPWNHTPAFNINRANLIIVTHLKVASKKSRIKQRGGGGGKGGREAPCLI